MVYSEKSLVDRIFYRKAGNPFALSLGWIFLVQGAHTLYALDSIPLPPELAKGGHQQFLTNLSFVFTLLYFGINVLYHLLQFEGLATLKMFMGAIATSAEFIVSSVYWGLRFFATDLIIVDNQVIPLPLDLLLHLAPIASLYVDYFLFQNRWEISDSTGLGIMMLLTLAYWKWLEHLIGLDGNYPYPFLNVDVQTRAVIFVAVGLTAFGGFLACKYMHPVLKSGKQKIANKSE
ncbi:DEKNAAC101304 [Brettanomyces naardenensis]|uniref:DEKNAAC101304 n=1 Tax=Brettanomyces naardenensis TaxID=13370 RepID=A0A448YHG6_BRENA|nr:DEKNAAC101304 [Brettanomyces naardenensis]